MWRIGGRKVYMLTQGDLYGSGPREKRVPRKQLVVEISLGARQKSAEAIVLPPKRQEVPNVRCQGVDSEMGGLAKKAANLLGKKSCPVKDRLEAEMKPGAPSRQHEGGEPNKAKRN